MSVIFECLNPKCQHHSIGAFKDGQWHPSKGAQCECDYPLDLLFVCDACGGKCLGKFDEELHEWVPPNAHWRSFLLEDWEVHGCCTECWDAVLTQMSVLDSTNTSFINGLNNSSEAPASVTSFREDDRTPSDAFRL